MSEKPGEKASSVTQDMSALDTAATLPTGMSAAENAPTIAAPPIQNIIHDSQHVDATADTAIARPQVSAPADPASATLPVESKPYAHHSFPELVPLSSEERRYAIAGEFARGGLGRILQATDTRLRRQVALKELLHDDRELESRFLREALVTARLQHPSIIPLYDAGRRQDGRLFYSMKLVFGRSLEEAIAAKKTLAERLSLLPHVIDVADAMAYAHSKKVIHRDLKPQNVLVGEFGETVVIDWGIAKDLSQGNADSTPGELERPEGAPSLDELNTHLTMDGTIMGTPAYMPPEQARGQAVDERADVYALGAILYQLMAGAAPYQGMSVREILSGLMCDPPMPPKPLHQVLSGVPKDLSAVVTKAMAADLDVRYRTAQGLVEDLKKFQTGQIVGAYRYTARELLLRWLRRNKVVASLGLLLVLVGVVSVVQIVEKSKIAEQGRRIAEAERSKAEEAREKAAQAEERERRRADEITLEQARASLDRDPQKSLKLLTQLSPGFSRMSAARVIAADALSRQRPKVFRGHDAGILRLQFSPDGSRLASASYDGSARVWDVAGGKSKVFAGHTGEVIQALISPDGKRLATVSYDKTARLWDMETGASQVLNGHSDWLSDAVFSVDGRWLATVAADKTVRLWDLNEGSPLSGKVLWTDDNWIPDLAFLEGNRLLWLNASDQLHMVNVETGKEEPLPEGFSDAGAMQLSSDGRVVATADPEGNCRLWKVGASKALVLKGGAAALAVDVAFSGDQSLLAVGRENNSIEVWDTVSGKLIRTLDRLESSLWTLDMSRDGQWVAAGLSNGAVALFRVGIWEARMLRAHENKVNDIAFSPDNKMLATGSMDSTVRLWSLDRREIVFADREGMPRDLAFAGDGRVMSVTAPDKEATLWDLGSGQAEPLAGHQDVILHARVSADGKIAASASADKTLRVWDVSKRPAVLLHVLEGHEDGVQDLALSADGKVLLSWGMDKTLRLWDMSGPSGASSKLLSWDGGRPAGLLLSEDGRIAVAGRRDNGISVWDLKTGEHRVLRGHESLITGLMLAPDRHTLASCSLDRTARLWDLRTGESQVFAGKDGGLHTVALAPKQKLLATGSNNGVLRVWDLQTGKSRAFLGHQESVVSVVFAQDERTLVSGGHDLSVRVWDVQTGESRVLRGHRGEMIRVAVGINGRQIASMDDKGEVRVWVDDLPHDEAQLRAKLKELAAE